MTKQSNETNAPVKRHERTISAGALITLIALALLAIAALLWFTVLRGIADRQVSIPEKPKLEQELPTAEPEIITATDPQPEQTPEADDQSNSEDGEQTQDSETTDTPENGDAEDALPVFTEAPAETEQTQTLNLQLYSESAILIDLETNTVISEKEPDARIFPASMTKVMTALVACEHIENWDDTFHMTQSIIDPLYLADATLAGFVDGEDVNMLDLVYGTILPSGAEATEALAITIAGSEEAFAEQMKEKAVELGHVNTHFVDASGLHDDNHYTTVRDMSVILRAAMQNEICRQVLSAATYTTKPTEQHPDGLSMYNKFLSRVGVADQNGAEIQGAKTGYTTQAMNCCASFGLSPSGRRLLAVTAHAWTGDFCIEDHIALYSIYNGE